MDWKGMKGKKYFIRTIHNKFYNGVVLEVDQSSLPLIFITLKDKFGMNVTLVHSEVAEAKEE